MEWNVFMHDTNKRQIIVYNIFSHCNFSKEVTKLMKEFISEDMSDDLFKIKLKDLLMYFFWSKCEYEVIIKEFVGNHAEIKVDVFEQVMINFDKFANYLIETAVND